MPKTPALTPTQRNELRSFMAASMKTYLAELSARYFKNPTSAESRELMLEALASALYDLTANEAVGRAVLSTFAAELQDKESK